MYKEDQRVRAVGTITEGGPLTAGNPEAVFPQNSYIHASKGDEGTVVHVTDKSCFTVQFDRTGTATIVGPSEVENV